MKTFFKKLCLASSFLAVPFITLATTGVCHPADPSFCSCFKNNAIANCIEKGRQHHIGPRMCKWEIISPRIKNTPNVPKFCHDYAYMFPDDATSNDCIEGIEFAQQHCPL